MLLSQTGEQHFWELLRTGLTGRLLCGCGYLKTFWQGCKKTIDNLSGFC